jgi:hypothetical protein
MSNIKYLLNRIRGWLPKDSLPSAVTAQANPKTSHSRLKTYTAIFGVTFATALIVTGILYGLGFGNNFATFASVTIGVLATLLFSVRKSTQNKPLTPEGRRLAMIIVVANVGMVGVFLGTYLWINPLFTSEVTLGLWIVILAAFFLVNNLLYRNLKKTNRHGGCISDF